jgi:hypothetical protein
LKWGGGKSFKNKIVNGSLVLVLNEYSKICPENVAACSGVGASSEYQVLKTLSRALEINELETTVKAES